MFTTRPQTQFRRLWGILLFLFIVFPASSVGQYAYYADTTPAKEWMNLKQEHRAFFTLGFLAGVEYAYKEEGKVLSFTENRSMKEVTHLVYSELLAHPELREGPIGLIIANILNYQVSAIQKYSKPPSPMLSEVNQ